MKRARTPDEVEIAEQVNAVAHDVAVTLQTLSPAEAIVALSLATAIIVSAIPLQPDKTDAEAVELIGRQAKEMLEGIRAKGAFRS